LPLTAQVVQETGGITRQQAEDILKELRQIRQLLERPPVAARGPQEEAPARAKISDLTGVSMLGSKNAPLTIVEFTDYQCPFCQRFHVTAFPELKKAYIDTGKVRFFSKDMPLDFHPNAMRAAMAARCAGEQNKFWELRDTMGANPNSLDHITCLMDPSRRLVWVTAVNTAKQLIIGYIFKRAEYPFRNRQPGANQVFARQNPCFAGRAGGNCSQNRGIARADVVVITFADPQAALRVLQHVRELRPDLPVVARAAEDADVDRLALAGATEVVPEALESSIMLATHALALLGVPMHRVIKRLREMREARYVLLRGFFHGASDASEHLSDAEQPRLHAITLTAGAYAIGRSVAELELERKTAAKVSTVRRRGLGRLPRGELLREGDAVVLLGIPAALAAAEESLLGGGK
jgi:Trk K+ transport system NAD-binding subunit